MFTSLCKIGTIQRMTGVGGDVLVGHFDDWIDRLYPIAQALLNQAEKNKMQARNQRKSERRNRAG